MPQPSVYHTSKAFTCIEQKNMRHVWHSFLSLRFICIPYEFNLFFFRCLCADCFFFFFFFISFVPLLLLIPILLILIILILLLIFLLSPYVALSFFLRCWLGFVLLFFVCPISWRWSSKCEAFVRCLRVWAVWLSHNALAYGRKK